jgi:hypothetical protein
MTRTLSILFLLLLALPALGADYIVNPAAQVGDGSSWTSPDYNQLPATLQRGSTYWLADGEYSDTTIDTANSDTDRITVIKATQANHASSGVTNGWSSTFGDGEAVFGVVYLKTDYVTLDGITLDAEYYPNLPAQAWRFNEGGSRVGLLDMYDESNTSNTPDNNIIQNVTLRQYCSKISAAMPWGIYAHGSGNVYSNLVIDGESVTTDWWNASAMVKLNGGIHTFKNSTLKNGVDFDAFRIYGGTTATISGCTISNFSNPNYSTSEHVDFVQSEGAGCADVVVERCKVADFSGQLGNLTDDEAHDYSAGITFRNNVFANTYNTIFVGHPNVKFYNNTFYKVAAGGYSHPISVMQQTDYDPYGFTAVGNVFLECGSTPGSTSQGLIGFSGTSASEYTISHNYFGGTSYAAKSSPPGTDNVNGGDPAFTDAANFDFTIGESSVLKDEGTTIAGFSDDYAGTARPIGAAWDIGAYEYGAAPEGTAPSIVGDLSDQGGSVGQLVSFTVAASGTAPLSYRWETNGVTDAADTDNTYSLTVAADSPTNYQVFVTNAFGAATSSLATLTIDTSPIIGLSSTVLDFGAVAASSSKTNTIQVRNDGVDALVGSATNIAAPFHIVSGSPWNVSGGATNPVLIRFSPTEAGSFTNTVTMGGGGSATLTLYGVSPTVHGTSWSTTNGGVIVSPMAITDNYVSQSTQETDPRITGSATYLFSVSTSGVYYVTLDALAPNDGANSVFVSIDSTPISSNLSYSVADLNPTNASWASFVLPMRGTGTEEAPDFPTNYWQLYTGSNHTFRLYGREAGVQVSNVTLTLVVEEAPASAPVITRDQTATSTKAVGASALFSAAAGNWTDAYWFFNDSPATNGTQTDATTYSDYVISSVTTNDAGTYQVVFTNSAGAGLSATSAVRTLTVSVPPVVTNSSPQLSETDFFVQASYRGASVTFGVAASGDSPFTYQWYYASNGSAVSGQTNSQFTVTQTGASHERGYFCIVTDTDGDTTQSQNIYLDTFNETLNVQRIVIGN